MKTISLKDIEIQEIIIRPNEVLPVVVLYKIRDPDGNPILAKTAMIDSLELPEVAQTGLSNLSESILEYLNTKEEL